jgi:hypothetical protein
VSIQPIANGQLQITVPYSLGFTMVWDSFKCELKSARILAPTGGIRRTKVQNARQAARLMISLTGKESALPMLRTIARDVAREVKE